MLAAATAIVVVCSTLVVWNPIMLLAGTALVVILKYPSFGVVAAVVIEAFKLVPIVLGVPSTTLTIAAGAALLLATVGSIRRAGTGAFLGKTLILVSLVAGPGFLISAFDYQPLQLLGTLNLLLAGPLAIVIGVVSQPREQRFVLKLAIVSLAVNAGVCLWQSIAGTGALVASGLQYGTTIREIDGLLRVPGLTVTNSTIGLFAGSVMLATLIHSRAQRPSIGLIWEAAAYSSGALVLVLSTSRSGMILFLVGALAMLVTAVKSDHRNILGRVAAGGIVVALPILFIQVGAGSSASMLERFTIWGELISGNIHAFGLGAGRVGASSYSGFGNGNGIFVDNSWLSMLLQYGVTGFLIVCVGISFVLFRTISRMKTGNLESRQSAQGLLALVAAVAVCALFVEVLDYVIVVSLLGFLVGSLRTGNHAAQGAVAA